MTLQTARAPRASVRQAPEPETVREPVRAKVRVRKGMGQPPLDIPVEIRPDGVDLQWVTHAILGMPAPQERMKYEINCWEPVTADMFDGRFDGMFMPKGHKGEIIHGDSILMWRPLELSQEARAEERQMAVNAVRVQNAKLAGGQLDGVTLDTQHPTARANTRVTREILSGAPIPK